MVKEVKTINQEDRDTLLRKIQSLIFLRIIIASLMLGALVFIQIKNTQSFFGRIQTYHYFIICLIYLLSVLYTLILKRIRNVKRLAYMQFFIDTILITLIIYITGGIESFFSFLYLLNIIGASMILYKRGGMSVASASSIMYGLIIDLHYYGVIHPIGSHIIYPVEYTNIYILYMILVNIGSFYLVGFITGYSAEQARKSSQELKEKKQDLLKLEALNELIIKSINSGLITIAPDFTVLLMNPEAKKLFNLPEEDTTGMNIFNVLPFLMDYLIPDREGQLKIKVMGKEMPFIDIPIDGEGKSDKVIRFSITPLTLPKMERSGHILLIQDITEQRKIEEEMKRMEGLAIMGRFAAGIAHEIRNPLASISGSIQMLKEEIELDAVKEKLIDIVLREINRLNHMVEDFLHYAKPKKPEIRRFDINRTISESVELFKRIGNWSDKIKVLKNLPESLEIESDPELLKQVLWNLFINAGEAMPEGGVISINCGILNEESAFYGSNKNGSVRITIKDTGKGFDNKVLSNLFTPFFTTKENGTGLGLATVKRIVEGLKGEVIGRNHPEGGAEITIILPSSYHYSQ